MKKEQTRSITPRKNLGQNFLRDANIVRKIITFCNLSVNDHILEIGPGLGVLTKEIVPRVKSLHAVEKDKRLAEKLQEDPSLSAATIHNADILGFDFSAFPSPVKVIGNLPYNISSPIIEKLIENRHRISETLIMVQLEFGKRLVATPREKDYSALSCVMHYYATSAILFTIKNSAFFPVPKVESCFLRIRFKDASDLSAKNEKLFRHIIKTAFQQRRKKLINSLASIAPKDRLEHMFQAASVCSSKRAEELSTSDYVAISNAMERLMNDTPWEGGD